MSEQPRPDWLEPGQGTDAGEGGTSWTGWLAFAGVLTMMMGAFIAIDGPERVVDDNFHVIAPAAAPAFDLAACERVHLIVGAEGR